MKLSRAQSQLLLAGGILVVLGLIIGVVVAAPVFFGFEAENGSLNGNISATSDVLAANGGAVQFTQAAQPGSFAYPVSVANRKFLDQNGNVYFVKTMSSWALSQRATNAEITQALEGLSSLGFNAVTVAPFGVHLNDSFGDKYKNAAGQSFFTGTPYNSSLGPAWSSMDWVVQEATRLQMTIVFSTFVSWADTGTAPEIANTTSTGAYNYGRDIATRYASYPNIIWHVMGDTGINYGDNLGKRLDDIYHGVRDAEGGTRRLLIAEPSQGGSGSTSFIWQEGPSGFQWFKQDADELYNYGANAVDLFQTVWNQTTTYPVFDIEPPYVNAPHYPGNANQQLRERNYTTFIRGGIGINFGHEKWWPHGATGIFDGGPGWLNVLGEAPQTQAKYAWDLVDSVAAQTSWIPDSGTFLKTGLGSGDTKAASGYGNSSAAVYFPSNRSVAVDTTRITGGTSVQLRWYDPTNGTYTTISAAEAKNANRTVAYPANHADGTSDWVLVVSVQ